MRSILAVDAGGTRTRAVVVGAAGRCLGYGSAGGGNPVSAGVDLAVSSVTTAAGAAIAAAGAGDISSVILAVAGGGSSRARHQLAQGLATLGLREEVHIEADLLATFHSGTCGAGGYALVAGTGSAAARVAGSRLDQVADGMGWLLGDAGSGYWIGHRVVRAVLGALDGRAPQTSLTPLLLSSLDLQMTSERVFGRLQVVGRVLDALYGLRPVELSRFAPLAFRAGADPVAAAIVSQAVTALATTLAAVRDADAEGPLVVGGSVARTMAAEVPGFSDTVAAAVGADTLVPVRDGLVGAAVLGLRRAGVDVDAEVFDRIAATSDTLRPADEPAERLPFPKPSSPEGRGDHDPQVLTPDPPSQVATAGFAVGTAEEPGWR